MREKAREWRHWRGLFGLIGPGFAMQNPISFIIVKLVNVYGCKRLLLVNGHEVGGVSVYFKVWIYSLSGPFNLVMG